MLHLLLLPLRNALLLLPLNAAAPLAASATPAALLLHSMWQYHAQCRHGIRVCLQ
jgi:hypothetical protein